MRGHIKGEQEEQSFLWKLAPFPPHRAPTEWGRARRSPSAALTGFHGRVNGVQISGALGTLVTVTPRLTPKGHVRINPSKERVHYQGKVGSYLLWSLSCSSTLPTAVRLSAGTRRRAHTLSPPPLTCVGPGCRAWPARARARTHACTRMPQRRPSLLPAGGLFKRTRAVWSLKSLRERPRGVERGRAGWPHGAPRGPWGQRPHDHRAGGGRAEQSPTRFRDANPLKSPTQQKSLHFRPNRLLLGPARCPLPGGSRPRPWHRDHRRVRPSLVSDWSRTIFEDATHRWFRRVCLGEGEGR